MLLLEALKSIDVEDISDMGICGMVEDYLEDLGYDEPNSLVQEQLQPIFPLWPEFSGDIRFPVPAPENYGSPENYFFVADEYEMWSKTHPYGAARRRLLEFCINQLEKDHA